VGISLNFDYQIIMNKLQYFNTLQSYQQIENSISTSCVRYQLFLNIKVKKMKKVDYYWKKNRIFKGKKKPKKIKMAIFQFFGF